VSFAAITLCVASKRVFIVVSVYFVIDSDRKLSDTHSHMSCKEMGLLTRLHFPFLRGPTTRVLFLITQHVMPLNSSKWRERRNVFMFYTGDLEAKRNKSLHNCNYSRRDGDIYTSYRICGPL
jgi:hypothetical protein